MFEISRYSLVVSLLTVLSCGGGSAHKSPGDEPLHFGEGPRPMEPVLHEGGVSLASGHQEELLPPPVQRVVEMYLQTLLANATIEACASGVEALLGGPLVDHLGNIRNATIDPALIRDWQHSRDYEVPLVIDEVRVTEAVSVPHGKETLAGTRYEIWIAKAGGRGAVVLLAPEEGAPRIVELGKL